MKSDDPLETLFSSAREERAGTSRVEFGFETRVLARIREERATSWSAWALRLCPYFAALALAAGAWGWFRADDLPAGESIYAAVRQAGLPALDYYLGGDE